MKKECCGPAYGVYMDGKCATCGESAATPPAPGSAVRSGIVRKGQQNRVKILCDFSCIPNRLGYSLDMKTNETKTVVVRILCGNNRFTSKPMTADKAERVASQAKAAGVMQGEKITSVVILPTCQDFVSTLALR